MSTSLSENKVSYGSALVSVLVCVFHRWSSVPLSCRGWVRSRRGRSLRSSGRSWIPSREMLSNEPDMKETSCWGWEVHSGKITRLMKSPSHNSCHNEYAFSFMFYRGKILGTHTYIYICFNKAILSTNYCGFMLIRWWYMLCFIASAGRNSAPATLNAAGFAVRSLALCLLLWHLI